MGACGLAGVIDGALGATMFTSDQAFGNKGKYTYDSYMHGRQYYYGISIGAAYKVNENSCCKHIEVRE